MLKKKRIYIRILGILFMCLSVILFGFVETNIPPIAYFCAWLFSLWMVDCSMDTIAKE